MNYGLHLSDENLVEHSTMPLTVPEYSPTSSGSSLEETSPVLWYGDMLASAPRLSHRPLPFNMEFDHPPTVATHPASSIFPNSFNGFGNALGLSNPTVNTSGLLGLGENTLMTLTSPHTPWLNTLPITTGAPADLMGPDPTLPRDDKHMPFHGSSTVSSSTSSSASFKLPLSSSPSPAPAEFVSSSLPTDHSKVQSGGGEVDSIGEETHPGQEKHCNGEETQLPKKKRTRAGRACEHCKVRKCRCDEQVPCGHCILLNWECVYLDTPRSRGRNKSNNDTALLEAVDDVRAHKRQRAESSSAVVTKPKVRRQRSTIPSAPKPRGRKPNRVKEESTSPVRDVEISSPKADLQSLGVPTPTYEPQPQPTWVVNTPFVYNNGSIDNGNALGFAPNGTIGTSSWISDDNKGLGFTFDDTASSSYLFRPAPTISYQPQQQQQQQQFDIACSSNTYVPRRPIPMYDCNDDTRPTPVNHNYGMGYAYPTPQTTPHSGFQPMSGVDYNYSAKYYTPNVNGNGW